MINFLKGNVVEIESDSITVDINNIGYRVFMSVKDIALIELNDKIKVFTEMIVREDLIHLYGFLNNFDKLIFNYLKSVSGIGNKTGLNVLSSFNAKEIIHLIANENIELLVTIPGIGKKTAQRIIVELKDKVVKEFNINEDIKIVKSKDENKERELFEALLSLGYVKTEINKIVNELDFDKDVESVLRDALILLTRN